MDAPPLPKPTSSARAGGRPAPANNEVRWLARLGIDAGLFSPSRVLEAWQSLNADADLMTFARHLIDARVVADVAGLEKVVLQIVADGAGSPPPNDPFAGAAAPPPAPAAAAVPAPQRPAVVSPGTATPFSFAALGQLDDAALAAGLGELLRNGAREGASDLHLGSGARPFVRRRREIVPLDEHVLTAEEALRLNLAPLTGEQRRVFREKRDLDYALELNPGERCRVNLMMQKNGAAGSYRIVPAEIRPLAELGYAAHLETLERLLSYHNGLVLVTGPVGSGKTTTLASMVAYLNATRSDHIITIEDPIEVVQASRGCNLTQREVGTHTRSFAAALKGALREDPDVIVIGELRDLETIGLAIVASETGHLVLGTMHTSDAVTTLNRILDVFPPEQQTQIRASVAESLRGIVCQRLLPAQDGSLILGYEILVNNLAVQNLIREGKTQGVRNTMETGAREGMCLMDNAVFNRWKEGKISAGTARENIGNRVIRARIT